jgi:hypothetical protein
MDIGGEQLTAGIMSFAAIGICISLFFEFINGFHDTANAVATVIYTQSLPPTAAVIWSGIWNFIGVLISSGTVGLQRGGNPSALIGPQRFFRHWGCSSLRAVSGRRHLEFWNLVLRNALLQFTFPDRLNAWC